MPYTFESPEDLLAVTELADYYRALPIFSRTLDGAMINSKSFIVDIPGEAGFLLEAATKLRNPLLFRECLVWVVSPWLDREDLSEEITDPELEKIVFNVYNQIRTKVAEAQEAIQELVGASLATAAAHQRGPQQIEKLRGWIEEATLTSYSRVTGRILLPHYFHMLYKKGLGSDIANGALSAVFANNLVFSSQLEAGNGFYKEQFFCAEIADEDLPWDIDEQEW
jgi:hypothetical protein